MKSLITLGFLLFSSLSFAEPKTYNIKWVLAHEPIGLFQDAAEFFSKEISMKTNGQVKVEILTLKEYEAKYNDGQKISVRKFMALVEENKIQMSQTYTTELGVLNRDMYALDLPFLFRDHAHAKKVLEGPVGEKMLAGLTKENVRGLAFTYSGGYRIIPSLKKISKVEDYKGLAVGNAGTPVIEETFKMLGVKSVALTLEQAAEKLKAGTIDGMESTFVRFYALEQNTSAKYVNDTGHSLFLTSVIINEDFWKGLPKDIRSKMKEVALKAAQREREHSVLDGEKIKEKCKADGIEVVKMSNEEQEKLKKLLSPIYTKFDEYFAPGLVASIQKQ